MRRDHWTAILIAIGFPLLMCGGCGVITLAMRPGHDASQMWLAALAIVCLIAALPFVTRRRGKK